MGPTGRVLSVKVIECFGALSEECGRGRKSEPPVVSSGNLTSFGKGERAFEFEELAVAKEVLVHLTEHVSLDFDGTE